MMAHVVTDILVRSGSAWYALTAAHLLDKDDASRFYHW